MKRLTLAMMLVPAIAAAAPKWQTDHSPDEMTEVEAEAYCTKRGAGWRLPLRAELEKVGGKLPDAGYLWSGEDVSPERVGQKWIMNLSNRHIFNGAGQTGFAKCVKGPLPKQVTKKLGPGYAFIGKAKAKLTVVVAVQTDYPWWKIRPTLDELAAKHSVRFDLRPYIVFEERWGATAAAVCAAAKAGKLVELESKLRDVKPTDVLDASTVKELALAAGVSAKKYDASVKACAKSIANDREALSQRGVDAVPTFWIGDKKVVGARPDELVAAVEAAL